MKRALATVLLAGSIIACQDPQHVAAPSTGEPDFAISDGRNDPTRSHFFFLAPIRPAALQPPNTAPFNPNLSPVVEICEWNGTACLLPLVSRLTMTDGLPLDRIYVLRQLEEYAVLWRTANLGLNEAKTYRIRVLVGTQELGYADVDVVRTLRQLAQVNRNEFVPLLRDFILPIRFRIEEGAASAPVAITLTPGTATIGVFQTTQLTATVWDAQGLALDLPIAWTVEGPATVTASGLATGVRTGTALITASAAGLTATATLEVIGDDGILSAGGRDGGYTCQVKIGTLYCWGGFFSLGGGGAGLRTLPEVVGGDLQFARVSVGGLACAVSVSNDAYCWNPYSMGGLGGPVAVGGGLKFVTISAGLTHACGVTMDGSAYCWGSNGDGQLGNGTTMSSDVPVPVYGSLRFATLTTGEHHSCGVTTDGAAHCWGGNSRGQLGNGTTVPSTVPVAVVGGRRYAILSTADADELGAHHTCGVATDHAAYCWGSNGVGELGDGTTSLTQPAPVAVDGGLSFATISARGAYSIGYTCGVTTVGEAYCWGTGPLGSDAAQLRITRTAPALVVGQLTLVSISAGAAQGGHTCGVTVNGTTYCWGNNGYGELGNGGTVPSPVPVPVTFP